VDRRQARACEPAYCRPSRSEVAALERNFTGYYGWHYPPTFLFVAVALAAVPYLIAALLWTVVTPPAYVATVRAIVGERLGFKLACVSRSAFGAHGTALARRPQECRNFDHFDHCHHIRRVGWS